MEKYDQMYARYISELVRKSTEALFKSMNKKGLVTDKLLFSMPVVTLAIIKAYFPVAVMHEYPLLT